MSIHLPERQAQRQSRSVVLALLLDLLTINSCVVAALPLYAMASLREIYPSCLCAFVVKSFPQ